MLINYNKFSIEIIFFLFKNLITENLIFYVKHHIQIALHISNIFI